MKLFALAPSFCFDVRATATRAELLPLDQFISEWKQSKVFTVAVADAMPPEFYDFKPNPEEMSFGQLMVHIASADHAFRADRRNRAAFKKAPQKTDKATAIAH